MILGEEAVLGYAPEPDNDQALKVLYLQPRSQKQRVKLRSAAQPGAGATAGGF